MGRGYSTRGYLRLTTGEEEEDRERGVTELGWLSRGRWWFRPVSHGLAACESDEDGFAGEADGAAPDAWGGCELEGAAGGAFAGGGDGVGGHNTPFCTSLSASSRRG